MCGAREVFMLLRRQTLRQCLRKSRFRQRTRAHTRTLFRDSRTAHHTTNAVGAPAGTDSRDRSTATIGGTPKRQRFHPCLVSFMRRDSSPLAVQPRSAAALCHQDASCAREEQLFHWTWVSAVPGRLQAGRVLPSREARGRGDWPTS